MPWNLVTPGEICCIYETTDNFYATKSIPDSTPAALLHGKEGGYYHCVFLGFILVSLLHIILNILT